MIATPSLSLMRYRRYGSVLGLRSEWWVQLLWVQGPASKFFLEAQDLGLHRVESVEQNIELRRRLWGACLICDRWYVLALCLTIIR